MNLANAELYKQITETIELLVNERYPIRRLFRDFEVPSNPVNRKDKLAIVTAISRSMKQHLRIEANILYPLARRIVPDSRILNFNVVETSTLEYMVAMIESMSTKDPLFDATVEVLGEYALQHFRSQDENLFSEIEESYINITMGHHQEVMTESSATEPRLRNTAATE